MKNDGNRDIAIERLLRQSHEPAAPAGACLDAETLAAWADGALPGEAAAAASAHAADCSRCLALLSAVVRTAPVAVAESWWARLGAARWLVPLTAAATAVAIWVAVPRTPTQPQGAATPPGRDEVSAVAPQQPGAAPAGRLPSQEDSAREARAAAPVSGELGESKAEPFALAKAERQDASAEANEAEAPRALARAAPPAAAAPAESDTLGARALASDERAGLAAASVGAAVRWRLDAGGLVERSTTGGASWDRIPTGTDAALTALAAPSDTVCWAVGPDGTVLLTTNARDWQRLLFPAPVDLIGIRATDARSALVATADGRAFATEDGGRTWTPRPLQEF